MEILRHIWSLIPVDDITDLSAVSKVLRDAGGHYIERHLQRRQKYSLVRTTPSLGDSLINFEEYAGNLFPPLPLLSTLLELSQEPILGEYVKEVRIDSYSSSWGSRSSKRRFWTQNYAEAIATAMYHCRYLECHDRIGSKAKRYIESIEKGNEDLLIGLLLSLLPEIRTLRLRCTDVLLKYCNRIIKRIASDPTATALSRLTTIIIEFNHGFLTERRPMDVLGVLAALPSLRTLWARNIGHVTTPTSRADLVPTTNVTELVLNRISINSASLDMFLDIFRYLEKFTYETWGPLSPRASLFSPSDIITFLMRNTKNSLTYLKLYSRCSGGRWMGSLANFSKLSHIRTDWRLLVDKGNDSVYQLVENLPATVQQLHLKVDREFDVHSASDLIENLVLEQPSRFPAFSDFLLQHITHNASDFLLRKAFIRTAKKAGLNIHCDHEPDRDCFEQEFRNAGPWRPALTDALSRLIQEGTE
ncbi:MAG: hypothetical protein Q9195_005674 [Heterodermia aff. obscurata]